MIRLNKFLDQSSQKKKSFYMKTLVFKNIDFEQFHSEAMTINIKFKPFNNIHLFRFYLYQVQHANFKMFILNVYTIFLCIFVVICNLA